MTVIDCTSVEVLIDVNVVGCTRVEVLIETEVEKLVTVVGCTSVEVEVIVFVNVTSPLCAHLLDPGVHFIFPSEALHSLEQQLLELIGRNVVIEGAIVIN